MYRIPKAVKADPERRWALPDRIFFACGACHILAYAFLRQEAGRNYTAHWIKPATGHTGNHIVAVSGNNAFDYHGHTQWDRLLAHTQRKAERWWPGWRCEVVELPPEVLVSEAESCRYEGLWLREPGQFLNNALPRAERFIDRISPWSTPE